MKKIFFICLMLIAILFIPNISKACAEEEKTIINIGINGGNETRWAETTVIQSAIYRCINPAIFLQKKPVIFPIKIYSFSIKTSSFPTKNLQLFTPSSQTLFYIIIYQT